MYLTALQASNGQYLCAEGGGGGGLNANRNALGPWETFIVEDIWAGTQNIAYNDPVGIRAESTNLYWCAPQGDLYIVVNRAVRGAWETFRQVGTFDHGTKAKFESWSSTYPVVYAAYGGGAQVKYYWFADPSYREFTVTILAYMPQPAP
jgi:hypothetical protein